MKTGNFTNFTIKRQKSLPSVPHLHERVVRQTLERPKGLPFRKAKDKGPVPAAGL